MLKIIILIIGGAKRMLVVRKAAKEAGKKYEMRFPDETIDALDKYLDEKIKKAADRAKKNGRSTLREYDF
ncbi:Uncharacterised protein [Candidatus Tiddalikarchaeum anstoanum]|nr:Uncharacterised protein [Candidatus Tiddalikarchaeum anstoanum]